MFNNYPSTLIRNGLPSLSSSNTIQRLLQQQQQQQQQQMTPNLDTNTEQIREKLQPLNTQRLKAHRQGTKAFIVNENFCLLLILIKIIILDEYHGKWRSCT
jgi:hypothetical protein